MINEYLAVISKKENNNVNMLGVRLAFELLEIRM